MKRLAMLICAGLLLQAAEPHRYESSVDCMGGTFTIAAYGADPVKLQAAVEAALEEALRLDALLSHYKPKSEWSIVNRDAGSRSVVVSEELYRLLDDCVRYSRESGGVFDITVGPLMKLWGFYKGAGRVPHRAELRSALAGVGWRNIILDPDRRSVRFQSPQTEIDPGGIGKGYAIDRMVQVLRESGVDCAFVTAAGSSMYAMGSPPGEPRGWRVSIRHPAGRQDDVASVWLKDQAMATSGSAEKFFMAGGQIYSHLMDPRTGYPAVGTLMVSTIGERGLDTEAWTKPLFVLGAEWARSEGRTVLPRGMKIFHCPEGPRRNRWESRCSWIR
jgi:FAD:protein FMN transferase